MLPVVETQRRTGQAMVVYTVLTVAASVAMVPVAELGWVYTVAAVVLGAAFLVGTLALAMKPSDAGSMRLFTFSITYLSLLFVTLTVDVLVRS